MKTRIEYIHMLDEYQANGIDLFLGHAQAYLKGERTVPVSLTNAVDGFQPVFFSFGEEFLRKITKKPKIIEKPYEAAIKYGFRGFSRGGRNGIFLQRNSDSGLLRSTDRLVEKCEQDVKQDLDCQDLSSLAKVKIVCHAPRGDRVVGVCNPFNHRAIFLGIANYKQH